MSLRCDKGMTRTNEKIEYFAAANTADGFVSFFDEVFFSPRIERRYIIKGGPGTGKSSLMRRLAGRAADDGFEVEYYYCSSDTDSLDGIVIGSRIAVFDGTAPHSYDAAVAGARDELINLGEFWDSEALYERVGEIEALMERKKRAYFEAYGYLNAAKSIRRVADEVALRCVDYPKLLAAVARTYASIEIPRGAPLSVITRQTHAMGARGEVELSTHKRAARRTHVINDYYGTAYLYLCEILSLARSRGGRIEISRDPLDTSRPKGMLFLDTGDYFTVSDVPQSESEARLINMKRFVSPEKIGKIRFSYRTAMRAYTDVRALALAALHKAGEAHASLEEIYVPCMDFERQRGLLEHLYGKIKQVFSGT